MKIWLFGIQWSLAMLLLHAGWSSGATNLVVGGFSASRSGNISFTEGAYFSEARAALQANFTNVTFTNLDGLNSTNLAGVNVLVLAPGTDHAEGSTPLSTNEQNAMLGFVQAGGGLLMLSDNYSYAANAVAEETALLSPLGMSGYGTISATSIATIFVPGGEPLSGGKFGTVTSYSAYYAGAITNVGPYASVLASNALGVALAVIPPGALSANSGPVAVFSDGNLWSNEGAGAGFFNSNVPLYLNTIAWLTSPASASPRLTIALTGPSSVKLQWPNTGIYQLQERTNLSVGAWTNKSYSITASNGTNSVLVAPVTGNLFYRLKQ